ncbi:MAG: hypothetical protein HY861_02655 [Chlamydiia bacterium]|nr:hypothetical protein [Chlamydiia bacterium]
MLRFTLLVLLCMTIWSLPGVTQEPKNQRSSRRGESAGYSSRDATVLSMMGWGLGLGVGIALLCALIPDNDSSHAH